jgi:hypothetical protein
MVRGGGQVKQIVLFSDDEPEFLKDTDEQESLDEEVRTSILRVERNIERYMPWALKAENRTLTIQRTRTLPNGGQIEQVVQIEPSKLGLPTAQDQRLYYTLISLWDSKGRPYTLTFSMRDVAREMQVQWSKSTYENIREGILRLAKTSITMVNSFFNADSNLIEEERVLRIISHARIVRRTKVRATEPNPPLLSDGFADLEIEDGFEPLDGVPMPQPKQKRIAGTPGWEQCEVILDPIIQQNLRLNHTRPVLMKVFFSFRSRIAQLMYGYFDIRTAAQKKDIAVFKITTENLFNELGLPIENYQQPSRRKFYLESALKELTRVEVINGIMLISLQEGKRNDYILVAKRIRIYNPPERTNPEEVNREFDGREAIKLFIDAFALGRPGRQGEIQKASLFIQNHGLTVEEFNLFLGEARRNCERTNFHVRDFSGIIPYFPIVASKIQEIRKNRAKEERETRLRAKWVALEEGDRVSRIEKVRERLIREGEMADILETIRDETAIEGYLDDLAFREFEAEYLDS